MTIIVTKYAAILGSLTHVPCSSTDSELPTDRSDCEVAKSLAAYHLLLCNRVELSRIDRASVSVRLGKGSDS